MIVTGTAGVGGHASRPLATQKLPSAGWIPLTPASVTTFDWGVTTMTAFVTVGSTKFDLLVESVLSIECLGALERRGYGTLIIQYGNSQLPTIPQSKVSVTAYKFKQSLAQDIRQADVVISHAGMRLMNWDRESTS